MRYQSALVLSTLAVGHAVASSNIRHAGFHARRSAEKRGMNDVDWNNVAYDFSNVDWKTVNYGNPAATPAPQASSAPAAPAPAPSVQAQAVKPSAAPAPAASSAAAAPPAAAAPASGSADFSAWIKNNNVKSAANAKTSAGSGGMWLGDDGAYKATFTNDGSSPIAVICWGPNAMWINANSPLIFTTVNGGASTTVSMNSGLSGGCGFANTNSAMSNGQLKDTILEFTTGAYGTFDVSREIFMGGRVLSAKGSQCTSGVSGSSASCVFGCRNGLQSCGKGASETGTGQADYNIALGSASQGLCQIGSYGGDPSGGCQMSNGGDHLQVTVYDHSNWPSVSF